MDFASSTTTVDQPPPLLFSPDVDGLAQAPAHVARAILVALCEDQRVRAQALRQFDRLLRFQADIRGQDAVKSPNSMATSLKRKATGGEPKICVQCDGIFTEEENQFGACWYHSGEMELMDETAIERLPGDMLLYDLDTEPIRARHPEAFRWCCCHALGNRPGCVSGRHESNPDRSKKGRGSEFSDLEDDPLQLDDDDDSSSNEKEDRNSQGHSSRPQTNGRQS
ncbi:uncharacterized protein CTRU02_210164 [Colletotrichum truncatum]|uniref:Uncharacterized protein n=1 Tax=Colletotrichum truncatum TaxID=5467 RepID=A0ACC3YUH4_COLTU|nr:uncharacterized protein CTRU02_15594 [Colletotrichum truncatum]KAF6780888.1 hypothetical protein CTRU02_15594 [Colletotrichum truncatum]